MWRVCVCVKGTMKGEKKILKEGQDGWGIKWIFTLGKQNWGPLREMGVDEKELSMGAAVVRGNNMNKVSGPHAPRCCQETHPFV